MSDLKAIEAAVDALEDARHYLSEAVLTGASADERDAYIHSLFMRRTALLTLVEGVCRERNEAVVATYRNVAHELNTLKWIGADKGWDLAIDAVAQYARDKADQIAATDEVQK